jgi:tetratricopeptide (TPR) repeat protein
VKGCELGLFDRFRSAGRALSSGRESKAGTSEQDALRLIDEGNAIEQEGRLKEAIQHYEAAIRLAPNLARAHLNRGNILLKTGDTDGALDAYAAALAQNPDYAAAHYNLGTAFFRSGREETALVGYHQAIAFNPDLTDAEVAL